LVNSIRFARNVSGSTSTTRKSLRLSCEFRAVVVLTDIQGMDYKEVAASVRVPLGTIKSRLARARLRLRECLQGFWELLPAAFRLEGESLRT